MASNDQVLSDVHVDCESHACSEYAVTRFKFCQPISCMLSDNSNHDKMCCKCDCNDTRNCQIVEHVCESSSELQYDSDGDIIVNRQSKHSHGDTSPSRKRLKIDNVENNLAECEDSKSVECVPVESTSTLSESHAAESDQNSTEVSNIYTGANIELGDHMKHQQTEYDTADTCNVKDVDSTNAVVDKLKCVSYSSQCSLTDELCSTQTKQCTCERNNEEFYINIKHSLATSLEDVGQQVWHGALLLCDFLLHHTDVVSDKVVVDLGAGVGLTSIVAAMFAKSVFSTDIGDKVLILNEDNTISANTCPTLSHPLCQIDVRELDWFKGLTVQSSRFGLSTDDMDHINHCNVLLAADVIYDFDMIDAFFNTVQQIMGVHCSKTLYVSLEKRIVFTREYLCVGSPAYCYFCQKLKDLEAHKSNVKYMVTCHDTNFPQYFKYNKSKYLELWSITSSIEAC